MAGEKVVCETPTPGKKSTRIDKWKYDAVLKASLNVLPIRGEGLLFQELSRHVKQNLSPKELQNLGSVDWYTATVKLDLEVRGEIRRVDGATPQRLLKC